MKYLQFFESFLNEAKTPKIPKIYTIVKTRRGKDRDTSGTLEELIKYFSYTLECGNSWNRKINRNPKNINALLKALSQSVAETQGGCYDQDSYSLKPEPEPIDPADVTVNNAEEFFEVPIEKVD